MKKCPCCGHENDDNAVRCEKCYVGFPKENDNDKQEESVEEKPVLKKRTRS